MSSTEICVDREDGNQNFCAASMKGNGSSKSIASVSKLKYMGFLCSSSLKTTL